MLCHLAEDTALKFLFAGIVAQVRRQFVKENPFKLAVAALCPFPLANGPAYVAFNPRHFGKSFWEIHANFVPISGLAFDAANAVVVPIPESVHGRHFDAGAFKLCVVRVFGTKNGLN